MSDQPRQKQWINEHNSTKLVQLPQPSNVVPNSNAAERAVIGAVLTSPDLLAKLDFLSAEDFYYLNHTYIWRAIELLESDPQIGPNGIDYVTVSEKLRQQPVGGMTALEAVGGPAYLSELLSTVPNYSQAVVYGRLVQRAAVRRRMIVAADEIHLLARDTTLSLDDIRDRANQIIFNATDQSLVDAPSDLRSVMDGYMNDLQADQSSGLKGAIPSGLRVFDETFGGFYKREVSMVLGVRGMGKTSFMLTVCANLARMGVPSAIFSQEMTQPQLIERLLAMETGIHARAVKSRGLSPDEMARLASASQRIREWPIDIITDIPRLTPMAFKRRLRKLRMEKSIQFVAIDGLWRMYLDDERGDDGDYRYKTILLQLAEIMKHEEAFNLPLMLLHQYNAGAMKSKKRPTQGGVRGQATEDAHNVYALHRQDNTVTQTEFLPLKHRDGVHQTIMLDYQRENMRYIDPGQPWSDMVDEGKRQNATRDAEDDDVLPSEMTEAQRAERTRLKWMRGVRF